MESYLSDNIVKCLTIESKRNLQTIEDPNIHDLSDSYLNSENIKNGINSCKEMLQPYLHSLLQSIKTKHQITKIESKSYDPQEFLRSEHNKITNIQKNTYAYNKLTTINTLDTYQLTYSNNICFKLYAYYDKEYSKIQNIIQSIINRLHLIVSTFAPTESTKLIYTNNMKYLSQIFTTDNPIPIHLYLYPFNRNINYSINNDESLEYYKHNNCSHCSSGYSNSSYAIKGGNNIFEIVCTRIPEILGLFTHEMFHILHCDTRYYVTNNKNNNFELISKQLDENSGILGDIVENYNKKVQGYKFLETFNNTTTTILHSLYCAIELSGNIEYDNIMELFEYLFKKEIIYSIYHTAKILHNQHINTSREYFTPNINSKPYHQLAYLYEYTIVRSFMFMDLDSYVKYMRFKDFGNFDGNDKKQVEVLTNIVANLLKNAFILMYNKQQQNKLRILYDRMFDSFVEILVKEEKLYVIDKNANSCDECGPVNMEYFCIDHNCVMILFDEVGQQKEQIGGGSYYYKKYMKYKIKYLNCKYAIRNV